jgi:hypothetical protein
MNTSLKDHEIGVISCHTSYSTSLKNIMSKKPRLVYHSHVSGAPMIQWIIRDFHPFHYILEYIKDEDVVRPSNHQYTTKEDRVERGYNNWLYKSNAGHQTYGTCDICFDSGPVMTICRKCKHDQVYQVFQFGEVELDSTTLANILERGLKVQYAC